MLSFSLSLRNLWKRHRRKLFVTAGVFGSGYVLYKLHSAHSNRLAYIERQLAQDRINDEFIKSQMQAHFENIQVIADTMTLPQATLYLSSRIAQELDLLHLTDKLMKGKEKDHPNTLSSSQKLELWDSLKILSFTRMVLSVWSITMLSLYIRVQVNIIGRHIYLDTARGSRGSLLLEEPEPVDTHDQLQFLATSDFLANCSLQFSRANMQTAATEVLRRKQLRDSFNTSVLHETSMQILDVFMGMEKPHNWVDYLMPKDANAYQSAKPSGNGHTCLSDANKFNQLMVETRAVLSSEEFGNVLEISLKTVMNAVMEDSGLEVGMPLAKVLPRVADLGCLVVEEASKNRYIKIIQKIPEVEMFFTLVYASMPGAGVS